MTADGSRIDFRIVTDLSQAEYYRKLLSPEETIYDLRDLRYCFFKYFVEYQIHFIVGFRDEVAVGLLPLHLNLAPLKYEDYCSSDIPYYEFFGSGRFQLNRILHKGYILSLEDKKQFYDQVIKNDTHPYYLHNIGEMDCIDTLEMKNNVSYYYQPLSLIDDYHDFIQKNFVESENWKVNANVRQIKRIEKKNRSIIFNRKHDIEKMFEYNIERFKHKSFLNIPSTFLRSCRDQIFRDMLDLSCFDDIILATFMDEDNFIAGVSLALEYKHIYYYLNAGDSRRYNNFLKYINLSNMQFAKERGDIDIDFMGGLPGCRKDDWGLYKRPLYIISNISSHD